MYSILTEEYSEDDPPSFNDYRNEFNAKKFSFHRPKKDQCPLYTTFYESDEQTKAELQERFDRHISEKKTVRVIKENCKNSKRKTTNNTLRKFRPSVCLVPAKIKR